MTRVLALVLKKEVVSRKWGCFWRNFKGNFAYELSITQKIVLALDLIYEYYDKKTFKGINGTNLDGTPATVGGLCSDKLSLAPAIEYNFTEDISLVSGLWFTVLGKNKLDFMAGIINLNIGF